MLNTGPCRVTIYFFLGHGGWHEQSERQAQRRRAMVAAVRQGQSLRQVAAAFRVSPGTVLHWVRHAKGQRLDRVDWSDRPHTPHQTQRTAAAVEDLVLQLRRTLRQDSDLGFYGAAVIHEALAERNVEPLPSVRTIGRILQRRGLLDGRPRVRRQAPPPGWYLPEVAAGRQELDSVDAVEGLKIRDGPLVEVLNAVSLHGGLASSWPQENCVTACAVSTALTQRWQEFGLPDYAQFDNGSIFQGSHAHADVVGRVSRMCLSLGVAVVFAPRTRPASRRVSRATTAPGRCACGAASSTAIWPNCATGRNVMWPRCGDTGPSGLPLRRRGGPSPKAGSWT